MLTLQAGCRQIPARTSFKVMSEMKFLRAKSPPKLNRNSEYAISLVDSFHCTSCWRELSAFTSRRECPEEKV
jgi:hypothetical protein